MPNIRILLILVFYSSIGFGQNDKFPQEHISNYDLIGKVKSMTEDKTEEIYTTNDKKVLNNNIHTYTFNESGLLLTHFLKNNDGFEFLTEKNQYNFNNKLIHKLYQSRRDTIINKKWVRTKNLNQYEIKYNYNDFGKLLATYQKRYDNTDFYIVELCTYSDSLLVEKLSLNNNIPFKYSDSFFRNTLTKYSYDNKGLLVNRKEFHDKKSNYYMDDSSGLNIIKPISIKDVDYSKFNLRTEIFYKYNKKSQQISLKSITHDEEYDYGLVAEKLTEYFGTKESKVTLDFQNFVSGYSYDYAVEYKDTLLIAQWHFGDSYDGNGEIKYKVFNKIYNDDKSVKEDFYSKNGELEKTILYDANGNIIEIQNNELNTSSKTYYEYDDSGNLKSKRTESKNSEGEIKSLFTCKYDTKGNSIYEELLDVPSNKIRRLIKRNITYHQ